MPSRENNIVIENAQILGRSYRNFSGAPKRWTPKGQKAPCTFGMALTPELVEVFEDKGVTVNYTKPYDDAPEDWEPLPFINVTARFDNWPPLISMITSRGQTHLDEDSVSLLDYAEIISADVTVNISHWEARGETGAKVYLNRLYVTIEEDPLDIKYANVPISEG